MMKFVSTRGGGIASLEEALFSGLASDGGLYMPAQMPALANFTELESKEFQVSAVWSAAQIFIDHLKKSELTSITKRAFNFPVPLVEVEPNIHVLELFHGPTHAFKDVGAQFMAGLMGHVMASHSKNIQVTVLVATSGDTGGAVAKAFHGLSGIRVIVLFPRDGVSERQRRQMSTLGDNVFAVMVSGSFDDCQRITKEALASDHLRGLYNLTSANSINIGRLIPQMFYYVHASNILGSVPSLFVVPSGNLGNLCAGLMAHRAGMPAVRFLAAMNANDTFAKFLETGMMGEQNSIPTISSAMDVAIPSNLERIRWLFDDDRDHLGRMVQGASIDDHETRQCILEVYDKAGYILDPHSAVAYKMAQKFNDNRSGPTVVMATAHPAKFPDVVESIIDRKIEIPEGIYDVMGREEKLYNIMPNLEELKFFLENDGCHA